MNFIDRDPGTDPDALMISGTSQAIDLKMDMENIKIKEERKNMLVGVGYFGFTFSFFFQQHLHAEEIWL